MKIPFENILSQYATEDQKRDILAVMLKDLLDTFTCPLSGKVILEPVFTSDGGIYEKEELQRIIKQTGGSFESQIEVGYLVEITARDFAPNEASIAFKARIDSFFKNYPELNNFRYKNRKVRLFELVTSSHSNPTKEEIQNRLEKINEIILADPRVLRRIHDPISNDMKRNLLHLMNSYPLGKSNKYGGLCIWNDMYFGIVKLLKNENYFKTIVRDMKDCDDQHSMEKLLSHRISLLIKQGRCDDRVQKIETLISCGASLLVGPSEHSNFLFTALDKDREDVVDYIVSVGAVPAPRFQTTFNLAVKKAKLNVMRLMYEEDNAGVDLDQSLHVAIHQYLKVQGTPDEKKSRFPIIQLVKFGAGVDSIRDNRAPQKYHSVRGSKRSQMNFRSRKSKMFQQNISVREGNTSRVKDSVVLSSIRAKDNWLLRFCMKNGARILHVADGVATSPLYSSVERGSLSKVKLIVRFYQMKKVRDACEVYFTENDCVSLLKAAAGIEDSDNRDCILEELFQMGVKYYEKAFYRTRVNTPDKNHINALYNMVVRKARLEKNDDRGRDEKQRLFQPESRDGLIDEHDVIKSADNVREGDHGRNQGEGQRKPWHRHDLQRRRQDRHQRQAQTRTEDDTVSIASPSFSENI